MAGAKRLLLAVIVVISFLPIIIFYAPVHATSANFTGASSLSVRQNPNTAAWSVSITDRVGCVNGDNDTRYGIGIRFGGVTIPQGATINSAYLAIVSSGIYSQDTVNSVIQGEDQDNAAAFAGDTTDYLSRARTTACEYWSGIPHWLNGAEYVSVDISDVVSEIVNRPTWTGPNMVIFWDDNGHPDPLSSQNPLYAPAVIRGGTSYKLVVDYTAASAPINANITTMDATNIGSSSAILNAYIDDDGDDSNGVNLRFGYSNATHYTNFAAYTNFTAWSTSNFSTGVAYQWAIADLLPSTTYYFNSQGMNSAGYTYGSEQSFVTPASSAIVLPSNFIILPSSTSVELQWARPIGYSESRLYFKVGSVPASNITSALLYSGSNSYFTHTGLISGTTYGYRVYGYQGGAWSLSSIGIVTTKGTAAGVGLTNPSAPFNWIMDTNYTTMNATFFYPIVNNLADSLSMPRDTAWVTWALGLSMFLGFIVWSASRSMVAVVGAVIVGVVLGWAQLLIPLYMAFLVLLFGVSIIVIRERM